MALQKLIVLDNGTSSDYWRVSDISLEFSHGDIGDRGSIRVEIYLDESARRSDKTPTHVVNFACVPSEFLVVEGDNAYAKAYNILKVLPDFADSTDV